MKQRTPENNGQNWRLDHPNKQRIRDHKKDPDRRNQEALVLIVHGAIFHRENVVCKGEVCAFGRVRMPPAGIFKEKQNGRIFLRLTFDLWTIWSGAIYLAYLGCVVAWFWRRHLGDLFIRF